MLNLAWSWLVLKLFDFVIVPSIGLDRGGFNGLIFGWWCAWWCQAFTRNDRNVLEIEMWFGNGLR